MSNQSEKVEAFFEGASNVYEGAQVNFSSQKIVIREIGDANKHAYRNSRHCCMLDAQFCRWNYSGCQVEQFAIHSGLYGAATARARLTILGLQTAGIADATVLQLTAV